MSPTTRALWLLAGLVFSSALLGQDLLVRGGRVITMTGEDLPSGDVLIRGGRVDSVGVDLARDPATLELNAEGLVVMPGFVLAATSEGLDRSNEMVPVVPYVSVLDSLDPSSSFFEDSLRDGHLNLLVLPGDRTVIGGMGRVVRPVGLRVEDMTVVADAGLKISLIPPSGNRAAHLAKLREALDDAKNHLLKKENETDLEASSLTGNTILDLQSMQVDRRKEALLRLLKGDLRAFVSCGTPGDVVQAVRLAEAYGIKIQLVCGPGTWRAAPFLAARQLPVILTPELELEEKDPESGEPVIRIIPRIFHDAGVRFAITSQRTSLGRRYLWYQAASLVRYGIPREVALQSVTTTAAELVGLGGRKGALGPGMEADLLVLTDDPLSGRAWVDRAVVGGRVVYDRRKDPRLAEVFGAESR